MINLKNGFYIKSDGTQFMLCTIKESIKKETGEKSSREEVLAYCGTLEQALNAYKKEAMLKKVAEENMDLKDVLKAIKELKNEIHEQVG